VRATIFNDIDLFGPHELLVEWEYGPNCFYLGDNVDVRNCHRHDLPKALHALSHLYEGFGDRYIGGNHELDIMPTKLFKVVGNTLLTHGDVLYWGEDKAKAYRETEEPGASWWKRLTSLGRWDWLRHVRQPIFSRLMLDRAWIYAKLYNCHTVICGHRHPSHVIVKKYHDINVIVLPRGKNVVELE
jgi:hypothetical protein